MHTRQSSLYFYTVKIKNFKHIYVQKNIKVVEFIENLHGQEVVGPWMVNDQIHEILANDISVLSLL